MAAYSGMAVTNPEAARRGIEEVRTIADDPEAFLKNWPKIVNRFNTVAQNLQAGYPKEVIEAYQSRSGAMPLNPITPAQRPSASGGEIEILSIE